MLFSSCSCFLCAVVISRQPSLISDNPPSLSMMARSHFKSGFATNFWTAADFRNASPALFHFSIPSSSCAFRLASQVPG